VCAKSVFVVRPSRNIPPPADALMRKPAPDLVDTKERVKQKQCFILSIDGGGMRGLIPLMALNYLEAQMSQIIGDLEENRTVGGLPLASWFDYITGTSTGGIIAAGLCCPKSGFKGRAACSVEDLIQLYKNRGNEIFNERSSETDILSWLRSMLRGSGIFSSKHDAAVLESELKRLLSTGKISESITKIILTTFDLSRREPIFITNAKDMVPGVAGHFRDYAFWEAARATSAAPVYLDPLRIEINGAGEQILVDGGVFANDPTLIAYVQALREGYKSENIHVLSLGAGFHYHKAIYKDADKWGLMDWLDPSKGIPLFSVLLEAPAKSTSRLMRKITPDNYFRVDGDLGEKLALDDASADGLKKLERAASRIVEENAGTIRSFAKLLVLSQTSNTRFGNDKNHAPRSTDDCIEKPLRKSRVRSSKALKK
jgi:uncharacterized protein